ncbi:zinc-dependent metalloprotease [Streptomyces sp. NPDC002766]|uniref:zinc-dependent metalloprotease n=1 Tax=unclassified Streptomyces TaxID=2593676 RepID=UPI00332B1990
MTRFTVLDDTRRHPELSDRIFTTLHIVAPHVVEATGLPLPPEVQFRLLAPKAWRATWRQGRERVLQRDIADLDLPPEKISASRGALTVTGFIPTLVWPLILGQTRKAADGQTQTILAPRALHHTGLLADDECMHQMVAHELVHHLQAEARSGVVWHTFFPAERNISKDGVPAVLEGHASWVDQQVTTRLFGRPVDHHQQAPRSWRYRLHASFPGIRRLGPSRAAYQQGARLVAHAVQAHGTDLINRVWKDTTLLPTAQEIADPDAWCRRITV